MSRYWNEMQQELQTILQQADPGSNREDTGNYSTSILENIARLQLLLPLPDPIYCHSNETKLFSLSLLSVYNSSAHPIAIATQFVVVTHSPLPADFGPLAMQTSEHFPLRR